MLHPTFVACPGPLDLDMATRRAQDATQADLESGGARSLSLRGYAGDAILSGVIVVGSCSRTRLARPMAHDRKAREPVLFPQLPMLRPSYPENAK